MATAIEERIKQQEEKLKQLKVQKAKIAARQKAVQAKKDRVDDTRRKILAGALILEMIENSEDEKTRFMTKLDAFLKRNEDRALFGFYALPKEGLELGGESV